MGLKCSTKRALSIKVSVSPEKLYSKVNRGPKTLGKLTNRWSCVDYMGSYCLEMYDNSENGKIN